MPLYAAQLAIVSIESRLNSAASHFAWMKTLPIPVINRDYQGFPHQALMGAVGLGLGALEAVALALVILTTRHRAGVFEKRFVVTLVCTFAVLSFAAPAMSTTDPYEYAATGLLGFAAYAPAAHAFAGTVYAPFQKLVPLSGVIYGPLWVLVDTAQTSLGSSVYQKIEAIRGTNAGFVALFLALLARAGLSRAALIGFALNPCTWFYFVANPHADIEGLALLAAAYGFALRSKSRASMFFVAAAGLIKLPFVVIGGASLVPLSGAGRRFGTWLLACALVIVVSALVPEHAYLKGLSQFAAHRAAVGWYAGWLVIAGALAVAMLLLVGVRRGPLGAAWLFQQLAILAAPWYLFWGVPYAIATDSIEIYLVALPPAAALLGEASKLHGAWQSVLFVVVLILGTDIYASLRNRTAALLVDGR